MPSCAKREKSFNMKR